MALDMPVRCRRAAFFDYEITVRVESADPSKIFVSFECTVPRDGETMATRHTRHVRRACGGGPIRMPEEVLGLDSSV